MKKSAIYSFVVLAGLMALAWLWEPTAPQLDDTGLSTPEGEAASSASSSGSLARSGLTTRQVPFADTRPTAPTQAAAASAPAQADTSSGATRSPVIEAIRSELRGEQKRKAMLDAIRSSGESDEAWTAEAEDAFETWTEAMPKEARSGLSVAEPRCYAAGCVADVTFASPEVYRVAAQAFRTIAETRAGHGGRVQTPSEAQGKRVVASWIMLRPRDL